MNEISYKRIFAAFFSRSVFLHWLSTEKIIMPWAWRFNDLCRVTNAFYSMLRKL